MIHVLLIKSNLAIFGSWQIFLGRATAPRIDVWLPLVRNVLRRFGDFCTVIKPVLPDDRTSILVLVEVNCVSNKEDDKRKEKYLRS